jgi:hypothetical protein
MGDDPSRHGDGQIAVRSRTLKFRTSVRKLVVVLFRIASIVSRCDSSPALLDVQEEGKWDDSFILAPMSLLI